MKYVLIAVIVVILVAAGFWAYDRSESNPEETATPILIENEKSNDSPDSTDQSNAEVKVTGKVGNELGDKAPDFRLTDINGNQASLRDYLGKQSVVIVFWKSDCASCISKLESFANTSDAVLAINRGESKSVVTGYASRFRDVRLLLDPIDNISRLYSVTSMPYSVTVNLDGNINLIQTK